MTTKASRPNRVLIVKRESRLYRLRDRSTGLQMFPPAGRESWLLVSHRSGPYYEVLTLLPERTQPGDLGVHEPTAAELKITDDRFTVQSIIVHPKRRGQGVATRMLKRLADALADGRELWHGGGFTPEGEAWAREHVAQNPSWHLPPR